MTVGELISELQKLPSTMHVVVWDSEEDDNTDVTGVIHELGHSEASILTHGQEKDYSPATAEEMDE